jgi:hypothetical protein
MRALWWLPSIVIAALVGGGALGSALRLLPAQTGFAAFGAGVGLAALALPALAGAAAFASSTGKTWRRQALAAAAIPLLTVLVIVLPSLSRLNPPIHDITTDPGDSLQLPSDVAGLPNAVAPVEPPRAELLALQREHYPDLGPLETAEPPERVFLAALRVAEDSGWEIHSQDAAAGLLHATVTSRVFGFVDDVVVRVQPQAAGARVDVRSRSRFGQSDLGANAARVAAYLERLRGALAAG